MCVYTHIYIFYMFCLFIDLFLDRGGGREREKQLYVVASCMPPTRDLSCNPGMCPDWELNWLPFGLQAGPQSAEPHQPRQKMRYIF